LLARVNFLTRLKAATSRALHIHTAVVQPFVREQLLQKEEADTRECFGKFLAAVKEHQLATMWRIRLSRYLCRLRKLFDEAKARSTQLETLRTSFQEYSRTLLGAICKGQYDMAHIKLSKPTELQHNSKLVEAQRETSQQLLQFVQQLQQLRQIEATYNSSQASLRRACLGDSTSILGDRLVLVKKNSRELLRYDIEMHKCESFPLSRDYTSPMNFGVAELAGMLYLIGGNKMGFSGQNIILESVVAIDLALHTLRLKAPLKAKRRRAGVTTTKGRYIFVIGGDNNSETLPNSELYLDSCETYDSEMDTWDFMPKLSEPKTNVSVGSFEDHILFVFGGFNNGLSDIATIERFDTQAPRQWDRVQLSSPDYWEPIQCMGVTQISSNEMLLFGGLRSPHRLAHSLIFKVAEKCFEKCADMRQADTFLQVQPKKTSRYVYSFSCHKLDLHIFSLKTRTWSLIPFNTWHQLPEKPTHSPS
jgi:hypothetical protein